MMLAPTGASGDASVLLALKRLYGCPYDAFFAGLDTANDAEAR